MQDNEERKFLMTSLTKITIHWTAGTGRPTINELEPYHYLIDEAGVCWNGRHKPEDNLNCKDGNYAAHTGGGNTGNIGVAMCGMAGYKSPKETGPYPITAYQFEACMQKVAKLCLLYGIPVTPETVFTHYEFGLRNPKSSSAGKIDVTFIPSHPWVTAKDCGSFIRSKVKWYLEREKNAILSRERMAFVSGLWKERQTNEVV